VSRSKLNNLKKEREETLHSLNKLRGKTSLEPTYNAIKELLKDLNMKEEKPAKQPTPKA